MARLPDDSDVATSLTSLPGRQRAGGPLVEAGASTVADTPAAAEAAR